MTALRWFGGHVGVRWNADQDLHLLRPDGDPPTLCGIHAGLRPVTVREADRPEASWCPVCLDRAQEAHRHQLGLQTPEEASQGLPGVFSCVPDESAGLRELALRDWLEGQPQGFAADTDPHSTAQTPPAATDVSPSGGTPNTSGPSVAAINLGWQRWLDRQVKP